VYFEKKNLPRIFISKPVLRFRLNDEVQLTKVQKKPWDENNFLVVSFFLHFYFFETGFPGLLKKNPPRHPSL
jgi:hypothetical protein